MSDHIGHRQRLKVRFAENGFKGFHDYEILELLLFYCIPQKDTKPLSKRLLKTFGSLSRVLDAPTEEIEQIDGAGASTALYLRAIRSLFAAYFDDAVKRDAMQLTDMNGLVNYFRAAIGNRQNEVFFVVFLNAKNEVLQTREMSEGTVSQAAAYPRRIVEEALKYKATSIILAHNHPGGVAEPSEDDLKLTEEVKKALSLVEVGLQEHILLADRDFYSFRRNGIIII